MAGKRKKSIPQKTRDFKINTRIIITSVLAIVIPILILAIAACIFVFTSMDRYDFTSVNTESYNVVNQIQWSQTVNNIAAVLAGDDEESEKLEKIKETADRLEAFGSILYIERNSELYYSTTDPDLALKEANEIAPINKNVNSYYYGESGIVIVNTTRSSRQTTTTASRITAPAMPPSTFWQALPITQRWLWASVFLPLLRQSS